MVDVKYRKEFVIGISQVDTKKRIKLSALENMFVECASLHCAQMGLGVNELAQKNLTWVISKMRIDFDRIPSVWETVIVETWPLNQGNVAFDRDFLLFDFEGKQIAKATSRWCLIDVLSKKPVPKSKISYEKPTLFLDQNFGQQFVQIEEPKSNFSVYKHKVGYSDLDQNNHVSNIKYFDFMFDCLDKKVAESLDISSISVNFLNEAKWGNVIEIEHSFCDKQHVFCGKTENSCKVFCGVICEK